MNAKLTDCDSTRAERLAKQNSETTNQRPAHRAMINPQITK